MRLFVALQVSDEIREAIAALLSELKPLDEAWKWTRAKNLHVTLKFLGEVAPEKLQSVLDALRKVPASFPFELKYTGMGFFPSERRPRVLWVGIEAPANLALLARTIDGALCKIGGAREEREFAPHLTLARCKDGTISPKLREAIANCSARVFGTMTASAFHLVESRLKSTGAEYTTLDSFSGVPQS